MRLQMDYDAFTVKVKHHKINVPLTRELLLFQKMKIIVSIHRIQFKDTDLQSYKSGQH